MLQTVIIYYKYDLEMQAITTGIIKSRYTLISFLRVARVYVYRKLQSN